MAERGGKLPVPASSVLGNGIGGWFGGQTVPVPPREPVEEEEEEEGGGRGRGGQVWGGKDGRKTNVAGKEGRMEKDNR